MSPASPLTESPPALTCHPHAARRFVFLALALTVLLDSFVQVLWKSVAMALPAGDDVAVLAAALTLQPTAWLLVALFGLQLTLWTRLLRHADLSFAQPLTSVSYLGVALLSVWVLGEPFTARKALSIGLILAGVWLIGNTPVQARAAQPAPARESDS